MSEGEIPALKEALFAQQQLLQKLYSELDEEREASSTAASEALSMILRLQGEKAAVKMEANQYKRLAEEKICHAEEALAIFEDLIYQKEMEIASLEYQVQAYKYRLLSLGCSDIGVCETKFPENLLQRNEMLSGETSSQNQNSLRRNSTPSIPFKFTLQKKGTIEIERSISPDYSVEKIVDENLKSVDVERNADSSAHGDINSYWEQIRRLDERVKEIADAKGIKAISSLRSGRSSTLVSPPSTEFFSDASNDVSITKPRTYPENLSEKEAIIGVCSSNVHDVFEVPQTSEDSEKLGKPECLLPPKYQKKSLSLPAPDECQMSLVNNPTLCFAHSGSKFLRQFNRNPEIVEADRDVARPEVVANRGEEEIKLLKEIQEQLNSIQSDIRSLKPPMTGEALDYSMVHLSEAMLHFWL